MLARPESPFFAAAAAAWPMPSSSAPGSVPTICSAHGATFDPDTGRCIGGPCYRTGLTSVRVEERDGAIYLSNPNIDSKENGHG